VFEYTCKGHTSLLYRLFHSRWTNEPCFLRWECGWGCCWPLYCLRGCNFMSYFVTMINFRQRFWPPLPLSHSGWPSIDMERDHDRSHANIRFCSQSPTGFLWCRSNSSAFFLMLQDSHMDLCRLMNRLRFWSLVLLGSFMIQLWILPIYMWVLYCNNINHVTIVYI
jgi:hypothetical protein